MKKQAGNIHEKIKQNTDSIDHIQFRFICNNTSVIRR
jgi:hypothetical protein